MNMDKKTKKMFKKLKGMADKTGTKLSELNTMPDNERGIRNRKVMRNSIGSNKFATIWRRFQTDRYDYENWLYNKFIPCNRTHYSLQGQIKLSKQGVVKNG